MKRALFNALREARAARRAVALVTDLGDGMQALVEGDQVLGEMPIPAGDLAQAISDAMRTEKGRTIDHDGHRIFIHPYLPPRRMLVIGAVHISQALAPMARSAGYDVTIVDPRTAWATQDRFPGFTLDHRWPDEVMEDQAPDRSTAVVALTHDPKIDDPGLEIALKSDAFYIGALGSKKTHAKRVARLRDAGLSDTAIDRINAPIGLDIGAVSQAEIAVAILAQITLALRGAKNPTNRQDAPPPDGASAPANA